MISIGLGEYRVGRAEKTEWVMFGLGSCIGLILADRTSLVSSAAHVVLPEELPKGKPAPARYGNLVVPFLVDEMHKLGATKDNITAQIVGGSRMFEVQGAGDIGQRNAETIRRSLKSMDIPVIAEDIGGRKGRTLRWNPRTGCARIVRVGGEDEILTPPTHWFTDVDLKHSSTG